MPFAPCVIFVETRRRSLGPGTVVPGLVVGRRCARPNLNLLYLITKRVIHESQQLADSGLSPGSGTILLLQSHKVVRD